MESFNNGRQKLKIHFLIFAVRGRIKLIDKVQIDTSILFVSPKYVSNIKGEIYMLSISQSEQGFIPQGGSWA